MLDKNFEAFIVYVTSLSINLILIHLAKKAQIALLIAEKVKIPTNYLNSLDDFSEKKALMLSKITKLNKYAIKLQED